MCQHPRMELRCQTQVFYPHPSKRLCLASIKSRRLPVFVTSLGYDKIALMELECIAGP